MSRCESWYNNQEFRAIIGACDMFWSKFHDLIGAKLRVCTLNSRFKDCSTVSEIRHLSQVSCKKIGDVLKYVFRTWVRDEIETIGKLVEEFNKDDSFFPYMREMRLSKRSLTLRQKMCTYIMGFPYSVLF